MSSRHLRGKRHQELDLHIPEVESSEDEIISEAPLNPFNLLEDTHDAADVSSSDDEPGIENQHSYSSCRHLDRSDSISKPINDNEVEEMELLDKYIAEMELAGQPVKDQSGDQLPAFIFPDSRLLDTNPKTSEKRLNKSIFTSKTDFPPLIDLQKSLTLESISDYVLPGQNFSSDDRVFRLKTVDKHMYGQVIESCLNHQYEYLQLLVDLHPFNPWILFLTIIMKLNADPGQLPLELMEKLLYIYERVFSLGGIKKSKYLPYLFADNRPFHVCIFLRAYALQRQGYLINAIETIKYGLQISSATEAVILGKSDFTKFDPSQFDPLGLMLLYDSLLLRQDPRLLIEICQHFVLEKMILYPNWMYSKALAMFICAGKGKNSEMDLKESTKQLLNAICKFPSIIFRILDRCSVRFSNFELKIFDLCSSQPKMLRALGDVYVHYSWSAWKQDSVIEWVRKCIKTAFHNLRPYNSENFVQGMFLRRHMSVLDLVDNLPIPSSCYSLIYKDEGSMIIEQVNKTLPTQKTKSWTSLIADISPLGWKYTPWGVDIDSAWDPFPPNSYLSYSPIYPFEGFYRNRLINADSNTALTLLLTKFDAIEKKASEYSTLSQWSRKLDLEPSRLPDHVKKSLFPDLDSSNSSIQNQYGIFSMFTDLLGSIAPSYSAPGIISGRVNQNLSKLLFYSEVQNFLVNYKWFC